MTLYRAGWQEPRPLLSLGTGRAPNSRILGVFPSREEARYWRRNRTKTELQGQSRGHERWEGRYTRWEQAGTVLGSRSEEGRDERGAGQAETTWGTSAQLAQKHLGSFGKKHRSELHPQRSQDSRLGREGEEEQRKLTATGRSMRQTDPRTGRTGRKCGGHHSTNPCREDGVKPSQAEAWRNL